jgi:hypothetical protein
VNGNGHTPQPELLLCGRCDTAYDPEDNFCRNCGFALNEQRLPSVRERNLPALWRPPVPAFVVRGAAVVAAGTIAEMLARRLVRNVLSREPRRERAVVAKSKKKAQPVAPMPDDIQMVSETLLLKRVRFRR